VVWTRRSIWMSLTLQNWSATSKHSSTSHRWEHCRIRTLLTSCPQEMTGQEWHYGYFWLITVSHLSDSEEISFLLMWFQNLTAHCILQTTGIRLLARCLLKFVSLFQSWWFGTLGILTSLLHHLHVNWFQCYLQRNCKSLFKQVKFNLIKFNLFNK